MNASSGGPRDRAKLLAGILACCLLGAGNAKAQWFENFDSYASGSQVAGQGGWQGWDGAVAAGALVSSAQAFSGANSIASTGASDLVHRYSGYTSGQWRYSARMYVPSSLTTGSTYFILLNTYNNGGPYSWSIQTVFDLAAGKFHEEMGTSSTNAIVRDQWVELAYDIDLTADTVRCYYNGVLFSTHGWRNDGVDAIGGVDLFANNSGTVYYDNITLKSKNIIVNTADNTDFGAGKTNLVTALNLVGDGDTIKFNIPGAGPHYIVTPVGGYPVITNNDVTLDGYTQPGSAPNSNTMLDANNAVLKIVLDSRNGEGTSSPSIGFGAGETGVLFLRGSNIHVRGFCFLGGGNSGGNTDKAAVNIDYTANDAHVSGCWIGVDVDGVSLHTFDRGPTAFGGTINTVPSWPSRAVIGVKAGPSDTVAARAQQNVIVGSWVNIFMECMDMVIAGNKLNVLPDGMHDVDQNVAKLEAVIETGRVNNNMRVGTDGDGRNDAEERNVFGGVTSAGDDNIIEIYSQNGTVGRCTNIVIAGNYFGVAVDGVTRFTNSMVIVNSFTKRVSGVDSDCQFGSDFDGVSDDIEANLIFMNNPVTTLFPDPMTAAEPVFCALSAEGRLSLRGNRMVNNNLVPYRWADGSGTQLTGFVNYSAPYMDTLSSTVPLPTLDATNSVYPRLKGTFPVGQNAYTNIIIDVYQLDPEGWANGKAIAGAQSWYAEGFAGFDYTNGFPQGAKYVGSIPVANTGTFDVSVAGFDLGPGFVTVTANYSADRPGTHRGRTHTGNFANPVVVLPGDAAAAGLTRIVPDVLLWYNFSGMYPTNGPVNTSVQAQNLGNWEPYVSVLGDSTFLVENNTFSTDGANQNFVVALQPAAGGAAKLAYAFYADNGTPFKDPINLSRQNGNPGRVAGDPRYGAVNYMTECETSAGQIAAFQSDTRWSHNPIYTGNARYATAQPFSLDPLALTPTPLAKAWDYIYGPFTTATAPANAGEVTRTGGRPIGLDNGNFVVMNHDKTRYLNPGGSSDCTTFSIISPDGTAVKSATMAKEQDIWDNMCAYRGGFAIRVHNSLLFYNNAGTLVYSNDVNVSSGLQYWGGNTDADGRGDALRIASDIRSDYVFFAGRVGGSSQNGNPVHLGAWDARTGNFVAETIVSDVDPSLVVNDRVSVAVDQYDRCCVVWAQRPVQLNFAKRQIVARVLAFDGTSFSYLTPQFYPFVNRDLDGSKMIEGFAPSVAMTPRQICIAARGQINSTNNPAAGVDTLADTDYFTVISHPAPMAAPVPQMAIARSGNNAKVSWLADAGLFVLQSSAALPASSWTDVTPQPTIERVGTGDENDRYQMTVPIGTGKVFWRLLRRW